MRVTFRGIVYGMLLLALGAVVGATLKSWYLTATLGIGGVSEGTGVWACITLAIPAGVGVIVVLDRLGRLWDRNPGVTIGRTKATKLPKARIHKGAP